jgi:hypothetical protein
LTEAKVRLPVPSAAQGSAVVMPLLAGLRLITT